MVYTPSTNDDASMFFHFPFSIFRFQFHGFTFYIFFSFFSLYLEEREGGCGGIIQLLISYLDGISKI